jgi:hypothetical protein
VHRINPDAGVPISGYHTSTYRIIEGEGALNKLLVASGLAIGAGMLFVGSVQAQSTVVDIKGTWVGHAQNIVEGPAHHHQRGAAGVKESGKFLLSDQTFTFRFEGQDGRRFWGTISSATKTERIVGSFSTDGKRVYMVDEDGMIDGVVIDANKIDICYRHVRPDSAVVGCELIERK